MPDCAAWGRGQLGTTFGSHAPAQYLKQGWLWSGCWVSAGGTDKHTENGALPPLAIERLERREGGRGGSKEAGGGIKPGLCKVWCLGGQERKGFQGGRHQLCQILLSGKDGDREASVRFEHGAPWQPG